MLSGLSLVLAVVTLSLLLTLGTAQRVRLVGGVEPQAGRLEVYYNGTWGTVCDDGFTDAAANVVCYMLGYGRGGQVLGNRYGAGTGTIWMDKVRCNGTETNIAHCQFRDWGTHSCTHGDDVSVTCTIARLVEGLSSREGRLEINYNGTWGNVCRNYFDNAKARVICSMLGYGYVGHVSANHFGAGRGLSWYMYYIYCSGFETNIAYCPRRYTWQKVHCNYVSIACFTEVKLVGDSGSKGRLEVYHNGTWGTVCNIGFTDATAMVICSMLGYGYVGQVIGNIYGAGSGIIWLKNVQCSGNEKHIADCPNSSWGHQNCSHNDDIAISCIADSTEEIALVGGENPQVGRLEVFHANQWGTVCDYGFTNVAAKVVCHSLGFGYIGRKVDINRYGRGNGLIWLSNVTCNGTEQYIGECLHSDWSIQNSYCSHQQDVAVACNGTLTGNVSRTSVSPLRLVGGTSSTGRLEVFYNGSWGTVCGDFFTASESRGVCKMLGFHSGIKIDNRNYTTTYGPIWLDNLRCNGTETDIAECSHSGWGIHNCQHREDVALSCVSVQIRLNGGRDPREGRIELLYNGVWGSVCGSFNYLAAKVVCKMLGFANVRRVISNKYGYGSGFSWLNSVSCSGRENNIIECQHNGWGASNCYYYSVRAVSCLTYNSMALFGGGSPRQGRLEVYHSYRWGTVCDDGFNDAAVKVVCYSLGFGYIGQEVTIANYGMGKEKIWLDDVSCEGTERHISICSHGQWGIHNCGHNEDVAVACFGNEPAVGISTSSTMTTSTPFMMSSTTFITGIVQTVRLVEGSNTREGRLEIYYNKRWRPVCSNYFANTEAKVVCAMLGYGYAGHISGNTYSVGSMYMYSWYLSHIQCTGTELNITHCRHAGWYVRYCKYVFISCFTKVKLFGDSGSKGRLEVYHNGTWGTVCNIGFADAAARVICSMLGYGYVGRIIGNMYGADSGIIWLNNVQCSGNEKHIVQCLHNSWGNNNCSHNDDVSISCIADSTETVTLVGGANPQVGRLEVFHAHQWGTVCDNGFTDAAARVVCYSLGFGYVGKKVDLSLIHI